MAAVGMEAAEGAEAAAITTPKVAAEDMKEEGEAMETGEAEGEDPEVERGKEVREIGVDEAVIIRAITKIQGVARGEEEEGVMEERGTFKAVSRTLATMEVEEGTDTMTTIIKMVTGNRREVDLVEAEGGEEEEAEEDRGGAGEGEEDRILTKDSLNSSSSMAGSNITNPVSTSTDTTPAKDTIWSGCCAPLPLSPEEINVS